jgi:hypothetical protein
MTSFMWRTLPSACASRGTTIMRGPVETMRGTIVSTVE